MASRDIKSYFRLGRWETENHYKVQKDIHDKKTAGRSAIYKFGDFLNTRIIKWIYHYMRSRFLGKHKFKTYNGISNNGVFKMLSDNIKITVASDWATDTDESDFIGPQYTSQIFIPHFFMFILKR